MNNINRKNSNKTKNVVVNNCKIHYATIRQKLMRILFAGFDLNKVKILMSSHDITVQIVIIIFLIKPQEDTTSI